MKGKVISYLLVFLISISIIVTYITKSDDNKANEIYQVYLNGNKIGALSDDDDLYDLINEKQQEIKERYNVKKVYPPNGFNIVKSYSYDDKINDVDDIYKEIETVDSFTVKGYTITVHKTGEVTREDGDMELIEPEEIPASPEDIIINVLDREVFEEALLNYVYSFVGEENYNNYLNNTQPEIKDVGKIIKNLYFNEIITIKENYISVKDKIYTDANELSQYLLFGSDIKGEDYIVKSGDTISSVSEANKLNPQEFLIANPKFKSEDSILTIGDSVSVALINPVLTLTQEIYEVEDVEQFFQKKVVYDDKVSSSYSKVTQEGINGITRLTETYKVVNGESAQGVEVTNKEVIRETVDQITTKGRKRDIIIGNYIDTGGDWAWPTNSGYKISSPYAYRGGQLHAALDISGTGKNSPIYAAGDGVVVEAKTGTGSAWSLGKYVVIRHPNGIYTQYAHLNVINVSVGQSVTKGKVIGGMGETGRATGVHVHFAAFYGMPYQGGRVFNPMQLYR